MHVYFFVRGVKHQIDLFVALAQSVWWRWKRTSPDGKDENFIVQGALRPSIWGAYEYVLPEDCLSEFLAMLLQKTDEGIKDNNPTDLLFKAEMAIVRKMFGAEKIPDEHFKEAENINVAMFFPDTTTRRALNGLRVPGVSVHLIGIKKDAFGVLPGADGYYQEFL